MGIPATQWQCELSVWRADDDGVATATPEYLGGCENEMEMAQGFAEESANRSGEASPRWQQLEEEHTITLKNLWLFRYDREGADLQLGMPRLRRNQRFVVVMLWIDEEAGTWHKRTWFGATIASLAINSSQEYFSQSVPIKAGGFVDGNGLLSESRPDLQPLRSATLRYVSSSEQVDVWSYDFSTGLYSALATAEGRIDFPGADGSHLWRMRVGGVLALGVALDGTLLGKGLDASNGTLTSTLPRVDFLRDNVRFASLTGAGVLSVPGFFTTAADPAHTEDFELRNGAAWLAGIGRLGVYAPAFADTL